MLFVVLHLQVDSLTASTIITERIFSYRKLRVFLLFCDINNKERLLNLMLISAEKLKLLIHEMSFNASEDALKEIYIAYYSKLFDLAYYYVRSRQLAEEIVQNSFMSLWERRKGLQEVHNFDSYVYGMVRNISVSALRRQPRHEGSDIESMSSGTLKTTDTPESLYLSMELMDRLYAAINQLPERCRLVFKLVREENLKYKEVAAMLNISIKTVEAHMALAIKKMREAIEAE
ncbi:RNA polymerase sigma-70 factor [Prevotella sp. kh1p2]|nr:RNA polymerase sigma-70 factor [Prevotella sp. kh1p2]SES68142.1 RNA polymerase sigma-70 factor, ECF subfamily [Prevotella sp. kh1p2]SFF81733.1 RNA polymerase sigma-70 factor, ECF subfamily [Prevotella sp. KH2C16]SNU10259.1 RNA polymerase sigma-70 factor, ECF subfamily [Prevotellaceae bacterium KH2P17]